MCNVVTNKKVITEVVTENQIKKINYLMTFTFFFSRQHKINLTILTMIILIHNIVSWILYHYSSIQLFKLLCLFQTFYEMKFIVQTNNKTKIKNHSNNVVLFFTHTSVCGIHVNRSV